MSRRSGGVFGDVFDAFKGLPFPAALLGAILLFILCYFAVPAILGGASKAWAPVWATIGHSLAILLSAVVLLGGVAGVIQRGTWRRLLDRQTGLASIHAETWQDFEPLVAEVFRRQGYRVTLRGGPAADGGVDLELDGAGGRIVVQCKHRSGSVGVDVVRALFGVMVHEQADRAMLVTSGSFTDAARAFAAGKPMELIDGVALARLIQQTRKPAADAPVLPASTADSQRVAPACPLCQKPMVPRTARRGRFAGESFWGCSDYPSCRGTAKVA